MGEVKEEHYKAAYNRLYIWLYRNHPEIVKEYREQQDIRRLNKMVKEYVESLPKKEIAK